MSDKKPASDKKPVRKKPRRWQPAGFQKRVDPNSPHVLKRIAANLRKQLEKEKFETRKLAIRLQHAKMSLERRSAEEDRLAALVDGLREDLAHAKLRLEEAVDAPPHHHHMVDGQCVHPPCRVM